MQRTVRQVDAQTGEVLESGVLVYVSQRPKLREGFVMTFQDALVKLSRDKSVTGEQLRVLLYLIGKLDFENFIHVPQVDVSEALEMKPSNVSRAIAALLAKGVLIRGPKLGRVGTLRLSAGFAWKGRVTSLRDHQKRHLKVVRERRC